MTVSRPPSTVPADVSNVRRSINADTVGAGARHVIRYPGFDKDRQRSVAAIDPPDETAVTVVRRHGVDRRFSQNPHSRYPLC